MNYREITPEERLKPFVKCFYIFHSESEVEFEDVVFPSGLTEIIFNLGEGSWQTRSGADYKTTPKVELWGQITTPLQIKSKGKHLMLGVRFLPHTAGYFLNEEIVQFNNVVSDLSEVLGASVKTLYSQLLETQDLIARIEIIEAFLLKRLVTDRKANVKLQEIGYLLNHINKNSSENSITGVASQYGITARYLQKLISQYTGVSPKYLNKINRFQHSLQLLNKKDSSLTSISYECGYFDQSHFIREFKSFTGITPSEYLNNKFPVTEMFFQ